MKVSVKRQYQEFVEYIEFPTVIYIYETGKMIASNSKAREIIGENCTKINLIWEEKTKLKISKEILDNGSQTYFNKGIIMGKDRKEIDIEMNIYLLDAVHIVVGFLEQSYKQQFIKHLEVQVPRMFWKDKKGNFLGMNRNCRKDTEYDGIFGDIKKNDIFCEEYCKEVDEKEALLRQSKEAQYNVIEQVWKSREQYYFAKMNRMPIINKNGTYVGSIGIYTVILNREEYQALFNRTLLEHDILSESIGRQGIITICLEAREGWPIEFVTPNFSKLGFDIREILNKKIKWEDIVHPDDYKALKREMNKLNKLKQNYLVQKYRIITPNSDAVWIQMDITPILENGSIHYYEGILTIIDEERIIEETKHEKSFLALARNTDTYSDFLTGLPNRLRYEVDAQECIRRAKQNKKNGYVLVFDLDDFKHINEGLGPEYGDILLQKIADDINELPEIQNRCYRIDGDEFLLLLDSQYEEDLEKLLASLADIFNQMWLLAGKECYCTVSTGISTFPKDGERAKDLLKYADAAAYEAKSKGKNRVIYYRKKVLDTSINRVNYEKYLRKAITKGCVEFDIYYQPIVRAMDKKVIAAEALLRWKSPELGFISPVNFISLSEYLGLIVPLGEYVLKEAFLACKKWNEERDEDFSVSINLSVVQLVQSNIVERIMEIARNVKVRTENIILEVTESLAVEDMELMKTVLCELKENGFRIALDDFGTGYSSLNHIMEMPLDYVKIDKSFVSGYGTPEFNPSLLSAIAELAHSVNMEIVVEGVETRQQMEFLMFLNTDKYQGFLYGKPVPKEEFQEKFLRKEEEET